MRDGWELRLMNWRSQDGLEFIVMTSTAVRVEKDAINHTKPSFFLYNVVSMSNIYSKELAFISQNEYSKMFLSVSNICGQRLEINGLRRVNHGFGNVDKSCVRNVLEPI